MRLLILSSVCLLFLGCASMRGGAGVRQQAGVAASVDDVTGVSIEQAVPVGQVALMAWLVWLSHRRETKRIARTGTDERV